MMNLKLQERFFTIITPKYQKMLEARKDINKVPGDVSDKNFFKSMLIGLPFCTGIIFSTIIGIKNIKNHWNIGSTLFSCCVLLLFTCLFLGLRACFLKNVSRLNYKYLQKKKADYSFLYNEAELVETLQKKENQVLIVGFVENLVLTLKDITLRNSIHPAMTLNSACHSFVSNLDSSNEELLYSFDILLNAIEYSICCIEHHQQFLKSLDEKDEIHQSLLNQFTTLTKQQTEFSFENNLDGKEIELEHNYKTYL